MFAIRLKNLRQSRELNQVQLAEKLGVKKQSISNWENDNIMPSIDSSILRGEADRSAPNIVSKEGHGCQSSAL